MLIKAGLASGLLLVLGLAGCSSQDDSGGVASAGGTPSASASGGSGGREAYLRYAQCMRENGVPNFPDPEVGNNGQITYPGLDDIPDSTLNAAEEKCREYRPFGPGPADTDPARIEQLRKYAQCIRQNGIPKFPDPRDDGSSMFNPTELGLSGPDDPKLKAAQENCRQLQPSAPTGAVQGGNG